MTGATWHTEAICRGLPAETFYHHSSNSIAEGRAKAICARCPVRADCLDDAIATGEVEFGIFGGLTPPERRRLARQRQRQGGGE